MLPIDIVSLKKVYGKTIASADISFNLKKGEILGLIGPNGAGKSTTINSILGKIIPSGGHISLLGKDATKHGYKVRNEVGFASAEPAAFKNLTVRENLQFVADMKGVSYDRIEDLSGALELNLSQKAGVLSTGNKKKLNIVAALLSSPKIIILDEPTSGLDPVIKNAFFKLVEDEKKRGATILISSHTLSDIQRLCDRVAIVKNGKVIAVEEMEQLKTKRLKIIEVETEYSQPAVTLSGVSNLKQEDGYIKFYYNGEMKKLIKYLNSLDIVNVQISDADLESIFLHFYE